MKGASRIFLALCVLATFAMAGPLITVSMPTGPFGQAAQFAFFASAPNTAADGSAGSLGTLRSNISTAGPWTFGSGDYFVFHIAPSYGGSGDLTATLSGSVTLTADGKVQSPLGNSTVALNFSAPVRIGDYWYAGLDAVVVPENGKLTSLAISSYSAVPEPASFGLLGLGLLATGLLARRRA